MKVECEKKNLEAGVHLAIRAISPKSPLHILSHFLIQAKGNEIVITSTDMELTVVAHVPVKVVAEGAAVVPARVLADIVAKLPDGEVRLEQVDMVLEIRALTTLFSINCIAPEEYPSIAEVGDITPTRVPQSTLRRMINNCIIAVAGREEVRVALTGILMQMKENEIILTSTDGRRLARMVETLPEALDGEVSAIVPQRTMDELRRTLRDSDDSVEIFPGEGQISFALDGNRIISRLIAGKFPNYETVMPDAFLTTVRVGREPFISSLERSLVMAQQKDTPSLIKLDIGQDRIILTSNTQDRGEFYEEFPAMVDGEHQLIAFNGEFILKFLRIQSCEEVTFQLKNATSMGLLRPQGASNYFYIVMPVRLKEEVAA